MSTNVEILSFSNTFFKYLCSFAWFDTDKQNALMKRYHIGSTEQGEQVGQPIFWHVNDEQKIVNGHIVTMDGNTGKIYDEGWYYQDGRMTCLFGEHLLPIATERTVALVKDEMTAVVMSCFPTPYIWLATGKADVTSGNLEALKGRAVVAFPDKGEYDRWCELLQSISNLRFYVSDVMERTQVGGHTIAQMVLSQQLHCHSPATERGCRQCHFSHEGINGTFCNRLHRYVEHGKGECNYEMVIDEKSMCASVTQSQEFGAAKNPIT